MIKFLLIICFPWTVFGWNDSPSCLYELETHFFPPAITTQAFQLFYIFQSQWDPILAGLALDSKEVPKIMRERARTSKPNPLEHPFDPEKTKELLLAVEYDVFRNVLVRNYFYDLQAIRGMFDYIVLHQQNKIDACLVNKKAAPGAKKF